MVWDKWYYFEIEDGRPVLKLEGIEAIPWYKTEEHWDEEHIHIKAFSRRHAEIRALGIIRRGLT